ncbi:DUF2780 domain-containing protein [Echinimonas agarilytica]|uniref:DUF2780 domain-containing protein n=1 Tax=Echinimonas agarilytica TaxID=1215918 RepID=A0AA41W424_9GAMM|nr:DUF2780 domain-containing protein [Echinimonas agarilytica]MCM2678228.1 DUF2780 domain-containing protein [Echinimonas agarilytica]
MKKMMAMRHWVMGLVLAVSSFGFAPAQAQEASLVESLTSQLDITPEQATGALGSLFGLAQGNMEAADFGQLASIVPGITDMIDSAPDAKPSAAGSLLGGLGGSLGESAGNLDLLNSSFSALGLDPEIAGPLVNTVYEYVQTEGGQALLTSLKNAVGLPF